MIWGIAGIVILTLLKILGILLLILLALFLLVLLVPIRYRVHASLYENKEVRGSVSWLWFLVRFPFWWKDGQFQWNLRILGIPFLKSAMAISLIKGTKRGDHTRHQSSGEKRKKAKRSDVSSEGNSEESRQTEQKIVPNQDKHKEQELIEEKSNLNRQMVDESVSENTDAEYSEKTENTAPAKYKQPEDAQNKKKHNKQSLFRRLWQKIKELYQTVRDMIRNIREKVHSVRDFIQLMQKDSSKRFICIAKENMLQLWRHLKPQKIWGDIRFGTGDPCSTGQALGGIAVFYSYLGTGVHITPDFEEACFEGRIAAKGRIRIITMLVILIRLIKSKDFRTLRRELGQWKEDL